MWGRPMEMVNWQPTDSWQGVLEHASAMRDDACDR